jgi:hypothetical protein
MSSEMPSKMSFRGTITQAEESEPNYFRCLVTSSSSGKKFYAWVEGEEVPELAKSLPDIKGQEKLLTFVRKQDGKLYITEAQDPSTATAKKRSGGGKPAGEDPMRVVTMAVSYAKDLLTSGWAKTPEEAAEAVRKLFEELLPLKDKVS